MSGFDEDEDVEEVEGVADATEGAEGFPGEGAMEPAAFCEDCPEEKAPEQKDVEGVAEAVEGGGVGAAAEPGFGVKEGEGGGGGEHGALGPADDGPGVEVGQAEGGEGAGGDGVDAERSEGVDGLRGGEERGCEPAEGRDEDEESDEGGREPAAGEEEDDEWPEEIEVLLDGEGPERDQAADGNPMKGDGEVLEEEGVEGPEFGPGFWREGGDKEEADEIGGEDALGTAEEEVAEEGTEVHAGGIAQENVGDEIAGEDEEEVDTGPEEVHGPGVMDEDHEQGEGAETVKLG